MCSVDLKNKKMFLTWLYMSSERSLPMTMLMKVVLMGTLLK